MLSIATPRACAESSRSISEIRWQSAPSGRQQQRGLHDPALQEQPRKHNLSLARLVVLTLLTTLPQWALNNLMHRHNVVIWHREMCEEYLAQAGLLVLEAEPASSDHDHDAKLARVQHALFLAQVGVVRDQNWRN